LLTASAQAQTYVTPLPFMPGYYEAYNSRTGETTQIDPVPFMPGSWTAQSYNFYGLPSRSVTIDPDYMGGLIIMEDWP
jgi:hypothetical protein